MRSLRGTLPFRLGPCLALAGCTSLLGDFTVGAGPDASTDGDVGVDATTTTDGGPGPDTGSSPGSDAESGTCSDPGACACDATSSCTTADAGCDAGYTGCTTGGVTSCVDLTSDPNNCGSCGRQCGTGVSCNAGFCAPVTIVSGSPIGTVKALSCDGTNVYWVNTPASGDATVYQVALSGGSAIALSPTTPTGNAVGVGVSGSTVGYALNWGGEQVQFYAATVGAASSATELLVFFYGAQPVALTNQGSTFYAAVYESSTKYDITQATLGSSAATTVVAGASGAPGNTMAAASNAVFWTDVTNGTVSFFTSANPNMMTGAVATGETGAQSLTTDGAYLYWVSGPTASTKLRKAAAHPAPQTASTVATVSASTWTGLQTVASDGTNVYWADAVGGIPGIYSVPLAGGTPALRAASLKASPATLAVCGTKLVWSEADSPPVIRAAQLP